MTEQAEISVINEKTCGDFAGNYSIDNHMSLGRLRVAREQPDVVHTLVWEDSGYPRGNFYKGSFSLESRTNVLHTWGSLPFACPVRHHHHVGSTCGCCGQRG
jgi:hypothetical protein